MSLEKVILPEQRRNRRLDQRSGGSNQLLRGKGDRSLGVRSLPP
ncbi:MAG: hypothetical protein V7K83_29530 [Nostoc sp.]